MAAPKVANPKQLVTYTNRGLYKVRFKGGGEVPKELSGSYTGMDQAEKAIRRYLEKRDAPKAPIRVTKRKAPAKELLNKEKPAPSDAPEKA